MVALNLDYFAELKTPNAELTQKIMDNLPAPIRGEQPIIECNKESKKYQYQII